MGAWVARDGLQAMPLPRQMRRDRRTAPATGPATGPAHKVGAPRLFTCHGARRSARTAFNPPKANALLRATSTRASRAAFGTTSSAHSGSGS